MRILTDRECMSGSGWVSEDEGVPCPECGDDIYPGISKRTETCPHCKTKLSIKRGILRMIKLEIKESE